MNYYYYFIEFPNRLETSVLLFYSMLKFRTNQTQVNLNIKYLKYKF